MVHSELTTLGGRRATRLRRRAAAPRPPTSIAPRRQAVAQAPQAPQPSPTTGPQQLHLGDQPEQGAQRAQVAAPEAVGERVQQDDREEHEEQRDPLLVARLDVGSTVPRRVSSVHWTTPTVGPQVMPARSSASTR